MDLPSAAPSKPVNTAPNECSITGRSVVEQGRLIVASGPVSRLYRGPDFRVARLGRIARSEIHKIDVHGTRENPEARIFVLQRLNCRDCIYEVG